MHAQTEEGWLPGLKTDLIQLCRERPSLYFLCVCPYVCVYACLVFIGWQAILERGVQHEDKWDRIKRVPARPHRLDSASWKKGLRELLLMKKVAPSQTLVAPTFCALIASRRHSPRLECTHVYSFRYTHRHTLTHTQNNTQLYRRVSPRTHNL